jgi:hypothetical protein
MANERIKECKWDTELFNNIVNGIKERDKDFIAQSNHGYCAVMVRKVYNARYIYLDRRVTKDIAFKVLIGAYEDVDMTLAMIEKK